MTVMDTFESQIPRKLYRMGEIVRHTGLSRQTVHNYTTMGLIRESEWTPGGHRLYDETVFGRLSKISSLKKSMKMEQILDALNPNAAPTSESFSS